MKEEELTNKLDGLDGVPEEHRSTYASMPLDVGQRFKSLEKIQFADKTASMIGDKSDKNVYFGQCIAGINVEDCRMYNLEVHGCARFRADDSKVAKNIYIWYSKVALSNIEANKILISNSESNLWRCNADVISVPCGSEISRLKCRKFILRSVFMDPRGYAMDVEFTSESTVFRMGCRKFSLEEAIDHWANRGYPDRQRGIMISSVANEIYGNREEYTLGVTFV